MKIKEIKIEQYRHLEVLTFDFTYPEGHVKAGQPLEKICFIGQSATGKTGILELIKDSVTILKTAELVGGDSLWHKVDLSLKGSVCFVHPDAEVTVEPDKINVGGTVYTDKIGSGTVYGLGLDNIKLAYINAELISKKSLEIFEKNPVSFSTATEISDDLYELSVHGKTNSFVYEISQETEEARWLKILSRIQRYRSAFTEKASQLLHSADGDMEKFQGDFALWAKNNENPLVPFADYLNPLLGKLMLTVDKVSTNYLVPIKTGTTGKAIPISKLSTGTKTLLLSMLPLFELDTKDAIVLLDEPERSLFPDIQVELISYYQRCAPEAQIIVATHSPFIAAAFEPEERFILHFDEEGRVCVRRGSSPIGDDPNDILTNDFQVNYYNRQGQEAYDDYRKLKEDVRNEQDPGKKKELMLEMVALGNKYNFG